MKHYSQFTPNILNGLDIEIIKTNKKANYLNIPCAFDIETTSTIIKGEKFAFSYIWQFGIGLDHVYYYRDWETDRKSTRLNSSHSAKTRMPSSA